MTNVQMVVSVGRGQLLRNPKFIVRLVRNDLSHGTHADYVLINRWFTNGMMLKAVCAEGLDVLSIVKQFYHYKEKFADWKICANFFLKIM